MDARIRRTKLTPEHSRTNNVVRIDQVFTDKTRMSFKLLKDRDDTWSYNNFTPGTGHVANNTPGIVASSTITQVIRPTIVNEMNFGYTHNRWGFSAGQRRARRKSTSTTPRSTPRTLGINAPRLRAVRRVLRSAAARRISNT